MWMNREPIRWVNHSTTTVGVRVMCCASCWFGWILAQCCQCPILFMALYSPTRTGVAFSFVPSSLWSVLQLLGRNCNWSSRIGLCCVGRGIRDVAVGLMGCLSLLMLLMSGICGHVVHGDALDQSASSSGTKRYKKSWFRVTFFLPLNMHPVPGCMTAE